MYLEQREPVELRLAGELCSSQAGDSLDSNMIDASELLFGLDDNSKTGQRAPFIHSTNHNKYMLLHYLLDQRSSDCNDAQTIWLLIAPMPCNGDAIFGPVASRS